eukprot:173105_1
MSRITLKLKKTSISPEQYCLLAWPWIVSTSAAVIGYNIRTASLPKRWIIAILIAKSAQYIQNYSNELWKQILPPLFTNPKISVYWIMFNQIASFTAANSLTGVFGGETFYQKHGIDNYKKLLITSLCNSQVYWRPNKNARKKALKQLLKLCGIISSGYAISCILKNNPLIRKKIEGNVISHIEVLGLLLSIQIAMNNVPSLIHYLIFSGNDDMEVIPPYDFVFLSSSIREFWKNWSRPMGEFLRYMIYEPLGGRTNFWISVPAVFAANCTFHYDFSMNIFGYKAVREWNKAFAIMGASITVHMLTENIFLKDNYKEKQVVDNREIDKYEKNKNVEDSVYWKIWCFGLFNVSMGMTLYVIHDKAMITNIGNIGTTLLFGDTM